MSSGEFVLGEPLEGWVDPREAAKKARDGLRQ